GLGARPSRQDARTAGASEARCPVQRLKLHLPCALGRRHRYGRRRVSARFRGACPRPQRGPARTSRGRAPQAPFSFCRLSVRPPCEFARSFTIADRAIGPAEPVYVIAEAGANHNRDLGIARELIDVAADAGADAVKFQTYAGAGLYSKETPRFEYLEDDR